MGSFQKSEPKHAAKMAREINMDTMRQNFWAESIKKETQLRRSWYSQHQSKSELTKDMTNVTEIMKRRASKLRSFVPKPVDRKIDGSEENETEDKLPELKNRKKLGYVVLCTQLVAMFEIGYTMGSLKKDR